MKDDQTNPYAAPLTEVTEPVPKKMADESEAGKDCFWELYLGGIFISFAVIFVLPWVWYWLS